MYADFERLPKRAVRPRWKWEQVGAPDRYYSWGYVVSGRGWGWWPYAAKEYTLTMNGHLMMHVDRAERKTLSTFSPHRFGLLRRIRVEIRNSITDYIYMSLTGHIDEP